MNIRETLNLIQGNTDLIASAFSSISDIRANVNELRETAVTAVNRSEFVDAQVSAISTTSCLEARISDLEYKLNRLANIIIEYDASEREERILRELGDILDEKYLIP